MTGGGVRMSNRTLTYYTEPDSWTVGDDGEMHQEGWRNNIRIERSAKGQPCILITIEEWDGGLKAGESTVVVEDARAFLAPVLEWLDQA